MENQVEEIKKKLDIVQVISGYIKITKRGRHFVACCPFHSEKTPSFVVSTELQIYKCFGCGKAGDMYSFVQEFEKIGFAEALEELAKKAGIELKKSLEFSQAEQRTKRLVTLNSEVARFYNYILISHPLGKNALDYVLGRGIKLETIKLFKIGFSPRNSQLIVNYLTKKGFDKNQLIESGTFGEDRYGKRIYDRFGDRLIFPLSDFRDRILGFSGRVMPGARSDLAKYINSPETPIYHKSTMLYGLNIAKEFIKKENSVIVTEGEFDMISPFQSGVKNIVAIKGTAFTEDQLILLKRYTETIILALDSDFAGNKAAHRSLEIAEKMDLEIKVAIFDKYKDPDEAVINDLEYFKKQIKEAIPIGDFLINSAVSSYGSETVKGKIMVMKEVLPYIAKLQNSVIRNDYIKKLSIELDSSAEAIEEELEKIKTGNVRDDQFTQFAKKEEDGEKKEKLEEYLLILALSSKKPIQLIVKIDKKIGGLKTNRLTKIVDLLKKKKKINEEKILNEIPEELKDTFEKIYLTAEGMDLEPEQRKREIGKVIKQIIQIGLKQKIRDLSSKITRLEKDENTEELMKSENEFKKTLGELRINQIKK